MCCLCQERVAGPQLSPGDGQDDDLPDITCQCFQHNSNPDHSDPEGESLGQDRRTPGGTGTPAGPSDNFDINHAVLLLLFVALHAAP